MYFYRGPQGSAYYNNGNKVVSYFEVQTTKTFVKDENGNWYCPEDVQEIETKVVKRGRNPKYTTDEERKEAKRIQNKAYRERKKQELIQLRRLAALHKEREQKEEYENDVNKLVKNVDHTSESDGEL
jgi:hypothetical protein